MFQVTISVQFAICLHQVLFNSWTFWFHKIFLELEKIIQINDIIFSKPMQRK